MDSTCSQVVVPPGKAVTVALILNEVITNTVKHGLPTQGEPRFHLELTGADGSQGTFRLRLGNNGPPIAEEVSLAGGDTLGMSIIANLAEQLGGEITLTKAPHPEFMLVAPVA